METIAVIFGGRSAEHDVSIVTALASVIKPLELARKYRVEAVYIAKDGAWYWDDKLKDIKLFSSGDIQDNLHRLSPASVQFDGGMTLIKSSGIAGRKTIKKIDSKNVVYLGYQSEVARYMSAADIFVLPSSIEGFPLSILEAMAMELAVVASDVGAVKEVLEDGKGGFVVTPGSAAEIVSVIEKLQTDPKLLNDVKQAGRKKVEEKYSNIILGKNYTKLYRSLSK